MDIIITIPKKIKWEDYLKEIADVQDGDKTMLFHVPNLPEKLNVGDRCYLCYNGQIVGFMMVNHVGYVAGFNCVTTGKRWIAGKYIGRSGSFYKLENPIEYRGFQGFRYAPVEWRYIMFREQRI